MRDKLVKLNEWWNKQKVEFVRLEAMKMKKILVFKKWRFYFHFGKAPGKKLKNDEILSCQMLLANNY